MLRYNVKITLSGDDQEIKIIIIKDTCKHELNIKVNCLHFKMIEKNIIYLF